MLLKQFDTSAFHLELIKTAAEIKVYGETQIIAAQVAVEHNRFFDYLTALHAYERFLDIASSPIFDGIKYAEEFKSEVFPEFPDYDPSEDNCDIPF